MMNMHKRKSSCTGYDDDTCCCCCYLAPPKRQKTNQKAAAAAAINFFFAAAAALFSFFTTNNNNNNLLIKLGNALRLVHHHPPATVHFPDEILIDILIRLPVRSLVRFKCVSKSWNTLISDPYFTMKHLNRAKNDQHSQKLLISQLCPKDGIYSIYSCPLSLPVQLVLEEDVHKLKLDCPLFPKPTNFSIHCCYDGLAIIQFNDYDSAILLLWNPSTRESIFLPSPEFTQYGASCLGLGYDSTSGDYKILHIRHNFDDCELPNEILALKGGGSSWRRINEHPRGISSFLTCMKFLPFLHAAFHWIAISRNSFAVVSYSISNEVYGEIPLPEGILSLRPAPPCIGMCVLDGMLCVHANSLKWKKNTFKIWALKEYGVEGSWMPLLTIADHPWIFIAVPKYRFADGEVLFWCLNSESKRHAFRTRNGPFGSWPRCDIYQSGWTFTESLISPKSLTY